MSTHLHMQFLAHATYVVHCQPSTHHGTAEHLAGKVDECRLDQILKAVT